MSFQLIMWRLKLAWNDAERGLFVLRHCRARKHPKIQWVEWIKIA